jgi:hypothetical protein
LTAPARYGRLGSGWEGRYPRCVTRQDPRKDPRAKRVMTDNGFLLSTLAVLKPGLGSVIFTLGVVGWVIYTWVAERRRR